jgi:hypothetical protein
MLGSRLERSLWAEVFKIPNGRNYGHRHCPMRMLELTKFRNVLGGLSEK